MLHPAKSMINCFAHVRLQPVYAARTFLFNFVRAIASFSFRLSSRFVLWVHGIHRCIQIAILCNSEWHPCTMAGRPTMPAWGTRNYCKRCKRQSHFDLTVLALLLQGGSLAFWLAPWVPWIWLMNYQWLEERKERSVTVLLFEAPCALPKAMWCWECL